MSTELEFGTSVSAGTADGIARLVHQRNAAQVIPTGWVQTGQDTHRVTGEMPLDHCIYRPHRGKHDPMLLVEAFRQSAVMVNHTAYGARMGDYQAWQSCDIVLAPEGLAADDSTAPLDIQLDYWDVVTRANRFVSAKAAVDIRANGRRLALVTADFTNHSAAVYRRIRGPYADLERALANAVPLAPPLAPSLVARQRYHDVVLSATDSRTRHQLRVDLTHPGLFDHPVDHAPGMLLLEAVRQAAYTGLGTEEADLVRLKCSFNRYSELDSPCWLQSARLPDTADGHACFSISAVQEGRSVLSAVVELQPRTSR